MHNNKSISVIACILSALHTHLQHTLAAAAAIRRVGTCTFQERVASWGVPQISPFTPKPSEQASIDLMRHSHVHAQAAIVQTRQTTVHRTPRVILTVCASAAVPQIWFMHFVCASSALMVSYSSSLLPIMQSGKEHVGGTQCRSKMYVLEVFCAQSDKEQVGGV